MFCKQCGSEITDLSLKKCSKCNTAIGKGGRFCPDCGKKLNPGDKCDCGLKKQDVLEKNNVTDNSKPEANPEFEIMAVPKSGSYVKKEEQKEIKTPINKRIAGNPLLEKIARGEGDNYESNKIIQEEAVKMVYGKDMTVEKLQEQRKEQLAKEQNTVEEKSNTQVDETKEPETSNSKTPEKQEKCENQSTNPSEKCKNDVPMPPRPHEVSKETVQPVQGAVNQDSNKQINTSGSDINDSKQLFPEAFTFKNMEYTPPVQSPVQHGPVSRPFVPEVKNKEKQFDGMWVGGLICTALAIKSTDLIIFAVCIVLSLIFGIVDIFLNERKTGIGVIAGNIIVMIISLISMFGGVL